MAVEAPHLNLFPPQLLCTREILMSGTEVMNNVYGTGIGFGLGTVAPLSVTTSAIAETLPPMYGSAMTDSFQPAAKNVTMKADSGLTYAYLPVVSRKRSREDNNINSNQLLPYSTAPQNLNNCNNNRSSTSPLTFLGEDLSSQIQRQQIEVDRLIADHMGKVRMEIDDRRKRYSRRIIEAVEEGAMKKLKAKELEIEKIGKLNWALEERVKSLCVENQIWRDLAQTNEATANALRSNLEQVLAQVHDDHQRQHNGEAADLLDDAQSCCGSNQEEEMGAQRNLAENVVESRSRGIDGNGQSDDNTRLCKSCGKEEACVLLLPCRHLCLCGVCGSSVNVCPICKSTKNCSLHVNL